MPKEPTPRQTEGGKGDADRSNKKAFRAGYDKIDWSKKLEPQKTNSRS